MELGDGRRGARERGTPQGGVISPLIANLFLHYTFDMWTKRELPSIPFELHADDGVCNCRTKALAMYLRARLERRIKECKLELHPEMTMIVDCKDDIRAGSFSHTKFDVLGYASRSRLAKTRRGMFLVGFSPVINAKAAKAIRLQRRGWALQRRTGMTLQELAETYNPAIHGWMNCYGAFHRSALDPALRHIDRKLASWALRRFKRLRGHKRRAARWLRCIAPRESDLFVHWSLWYGRAG